MDLVYALRTLRRRRLWAIIGLIPAAYIALSTAYNVSLTPPALHTKSIEFGAASTQLLIDSPQSSLADVTGDLSPLSSRAAVFAQFMQSDPVKAEIGRLIHVNPRALAISSPASNAAATAAQGPAAQQRSAALLQESDNYQLLVIGQQDLPLLSLYAQGPNAKAATAFANAASTALADYISSLQNREHIGALSRVEIRQLGAAQGGMVNSGASRSIAVLLFLGLVLLDCVVVIVLGGLVDKWRLRSELEAAAVAASPE